MNNQNSASYGERISDVYDSWYSVYDKNSIAKLKELAHGKPTLELGIGTGRIAIPLMESGVAVSGIEASKSMVEKLRGKEGGASIPVTLGDFSNVSLDQKFGLIFIVFNTLFSLRTQEEQVDCFQSVSRHLLPTGNFLVEAFVPDLQRFDRNQSLRTAKLSENEVRLDVSELDLVNQHVSSQHVCLGEDGVRLYPVDLRFAWPSELDLMARLAGLEMKHRWGDWEGGPFTSQSTKHISIYGHKDHEH